MRGLFLIFSLLTFATAQLSGAEQSLRVERLFDDTISVQIPKSWTVSKRGEATLIGPPGGPFLNVAYVEMKLEESSTTDDQTLIEFLQANTGAEDVSRLPGSRLFAYTKKPIGSEPAVPRWNIVKALDQRNFALVLFSADSPDLLESFTQIAKSVQFIPTK
jgi:hypothetical protein